MSLPRTGSVSPAKAGGFLPLSQPSFSSPVGLPSGSGLAAEMSGCSASFSWLAGCSLQVKRCSFSISRSVIAPVWVVKGGLDLQCLPELSFLSILP